MQAIQIFTAGGYEVTVHPTSAPRDLTRQIAERAAGYDLVVCTGGDGTLNEAVSGLMQLPPADRPPLGYIPGGTVNDVAKTLGLSLDPILAAQDIVTGREFPIDIGAFGKGPLVCLCRGVRAVYGRIVSDAAGGQTGARKAGVFSSRRQGAWRGQADSRARGI